MNITLTALNIYPVKGLGGIAVQQSLCTARGLQYDRRFMLAGDGEVFFTQRELPKMATVWVEVDDKTVTLSAPDCDSLSFPAEPPLRPARQVRVWNSVVAAHAVSPEVDQWLSDYLQHPVKLVYMPDGSNRACDPAYARNGEIVSFADGYPFLVISEESLTDLNSRIAVNGGAKLPMNRFRPNLVVSGGNAYAEDGWTEIRIGEAAFRGVKHCARCQVTTTDQATGEVRGPEPLATLSTYRNSERGALFGMNLVPVTLGTIRVGDAVTVL